MRVNMPPEGWNQYFNNKRLTHESVILDPVTGLNTDRSTNAPTILATNGILTLMAMVTVAARFYVRSVMLKTTGRDDWVILVAMICGLGTMQCFVGETHYGLGMHIDAVSIEDQQEQLHWQFYHTLFVTTGITLVKVSISFLLLRIVPDRNYRIFLWGTIVFLCLFIIVCANLFIFACRPITSNWDFSVPAQCFDLGTFKAIGMFNSTVVNIFTDVLLACLPIPVVWTLQVNKRTKISLVVVLGLGFVVCFCAIYKTIIQMTAFEDPDRTRDATFSTWYSVELFVGIIAASLPSLRPLFKSILETSTNLIRSGSHKFGLSSGASSSEQSVRRRAPPTYTKEDEAAMEKIARGAGINDIHNYKFEIMTSVEPTSKHRRGMSSDLDEMYPIQGIRKTATALRSTNQKLVAGDIATARIPLLGRPSCPNNAPQAAHLDRQYDFLIGYANSSPRQSVGWSVYYLCSALDARSRLTKIALEHKVGDDVSDRSRSIHYYVSSTSFSTTANDEVPPRRLSAMEMALPYHPTSILLSQTPSNDNGIAYAFVPKSTSDSTQQLVSFNISSHIWTANLSLSAVTPNLPFTSDETAAFIPSISSASEISVYTGSCAGPNDPQLWRFTPSTDNEIGNGSWAREDTKVPSGGTLIAGPGFLSSGFTFSSLVNAKASQSKIYNFGGMCPTSDATVSTRQSAANYSNAMLRLAPATPSSASVFSLELLTSRGPPIAEAGFTITGLAPTFLNNSGTLTQQRSYVLFGGHTKTAFLNTSTVALWNLPEESWSFVAVKSPDSANTELAIRSTAKQVDSRSGHTAVLTEDGSQIIVLGGWVGNTGQAADPQLVVLNIGSGFGGKGDWQWTVPAVQPTFPGIFGHGAVMLPGNVMMVLGGYNITTSTTSKRDVTTSGAMFFNATSLQWVSSYTNPAYVAAQAAKEAESSGSGNSKVKTVGLGAGLGLGFAAIILAIGVYFCYSRKLKKKREGDRERDLGTLAAQSNNGYQDPNNDMVERETDFPLSNGGWNAYNDRQQALYDSTSALAGYENLHGGHNMGDNGRVASTPKQITRKPLHSRNTRGAYQLTPNYDINTGGSHGRTNSLGTAGPIHPIYEADEDDHARGHAHDPTIGLAIGTRDGIATGETRYSDPFKDGPTQGPSIIRRSTNRSVSASELESPAQEREREIQEWVSDWAAADALLNAQTQTHSGAGRISPTRRAQLVAGSHSVSSVSGEEDGRTASNLSERSGVSSMSRSGSSSGQSRNNSLRGFITTTINPFASTPTVENLTAQHNAPHSAGSGSSFSTAKTSFPTLQAEGETLLPRPDNNHDRDDSSPTNEPGSPSKRKLSVRLKRGQTGWLGSLRRAIGVETTPEDVPLEPTREPSPTQPEPTSNSDAVPRRAVSASATLWRRKQGKSDWEDSSDEMHMRGGGMSTRSNTFTNDTSRDALISNTSGNRNSAYDDDEDWDIEKAVENRVVQVMFTVPKEKLRVVNGAVEDGSEVGSMKSRVGSLKSESGGGVGGSGGNGGGKVEIPPMTPLLSMGENEKGDMLVGALGTVTPTPTPVTPTRGGSPKGKARGARVGEIVEKLEMIGSPGL
ncbi:hypothetical protein HYFRA_00010770 [Hymenoscyphus fraxineus]|uniref:Rhodopsin domain-containing protein n=1 Tax=Hymenoscyphus fraxineus TaxID=746836 RepID=A0A9N9L0Q0_9HELO|nr:hypothetical protein HYFRA_00010770 [Hymenoscyphus fraxineus]